MLVHSVIRVMRKTIKGDEEDDGIPAADGLMKFSGLIPLLKILLVKKTMAWDQFLLQGLKFFYLNGKT